MFVFQTTSQWTSDGNIFLQWAHSFAIYKNQSTCWICGQLPLSNTSGLPWWVSLFQGTDWKALNQFIVIERASSNVCTLSDISNYDPEMDKVWANGMGQ